MGKEGHSAYPEKGARPSWTRATCWCGSAKQRGSWRRTRTRPSNPPFTTINVGTIAGGKARNIIPGHCTFPVEWRPIPGRDPDIVPAMLQRAIEKSGADATFSVTRGDDGVATDPDAAIVRFLERETGHKAESIPFGTELPQITALGAQGCVCGPGDIKVADRTGEFVPERTGPAAETTARPWSPAG